jgi:hypothetical protein
MKRFLVLAAGIFLMVMIGLATYLFIRAGVPSGSFPQKVADYELKEGPVKRQTGPDTFAAVYNSTNKAAIFYVVAVFPSTEAATERMTTTTAGFERSKAEFQQVGKKVVRTYYNGSTEVSWANGKWLCVVSSTQKEAAIEFAQGLPF